jgi:lambda family phage minor tail protein L
MPYTPTKSIAQSSFKSVSAELANLNPSAIITFFEIDVTNVMESNNISNLGVEADAYGVTQDVQGNILRFHNSINVFNSFLKWQGFTYYPAPIQAEGFETSSRGTLPTPTLTIATQGSQQDLMGLLRHQIKKFGDVVGAKVTRIRTFAKYLDVDNFLAVNSEGKVSPNALQDMATENLGEIPIGFEPDPYAELPRDIYYIERKESENKSILRYQLSSNLDLEGVKIPKRLILANRCMFDYRGPGCWYQHKYDSESYKIVSSVWAGSGAGNWTNSSARDQVVANATALDTGSSISVNATNNVFHTGYVINFTSGATFTISDDISVSPPSSQYAVGSTRLYGTLSATIQNNETGTINYSYDTLTSNTSNAAITSAVRNSGPSAYNINFSVAVSPAFPATDKGEYELKFNFAFLNASSVEYPNFQIQNATTVNGKVGWKQPWSQAIKPTQEGTNTLIFQVNNKAIGTGNNAMLAAWNTQYANWKITDVSLNKVTSRPPILNKAGLDLGNYANTLLPQEAPPVATDNDEKIIEALGSELKKSQFDDKGLWNSVLQYEVGDYVYTSKDDLKYYFVCSKEHSGSPPPNSTYWISDQCSKSLTGCRLRWGTKAKGGAVRGSTCIIGGPAAGTKGGLPYGGFPAATQIQQNFASR